MGKRRSSRILAMKALYIYELSEDDIEHIINDTAEKENIEDETIIDYAKSTAKKVILNLEGLNKVIENSTNNWSISRMAVIDRNILRIALCEIFFMDNVPDVVAIDEAIEIAKHFSTEDSGGFVNGILDQVSKNKEKYKQYLNL